MNYKTFIKKFVSSSMRVKIRKWKRHFVNWFKKGDKTTIDQLRQVLIEELGVKKGDKLILTSSYGQLNAGFSPQQVVDLLKELVGEDGMIVMPYYPPINSVEWAAQGLTFDMRSTKSGMGVLTNVFAKSDGVLMSVHPIKPVCVWGKGAEEVVANHENSTTPFWWDSPLGRMMKLHSKCLGLGKGNPLVFHTIEDVLSPNKEYWYQPDKYNLDIILKDGSKKTVSTFVHNEALLDKCDTVADYVPTLHCKTYKRVNFGYGFVYIVDNDDLFERCKEEFDKGNTRFHHPF